MKRREPGVTKRVDIAVDRGAEELIPADICTLHSPSGIWVVEVEGKTVVRAYPEDVDRYIAAMKGSGLILGEIVVVEEADLDYAGMTKRYFQPVIVEDVVIRAPWNNTKKSFPSITIEPGMAFGTGRHESTRLMMKLIRAVDMKGKLVLDVGCGSAVLSLYARMKGAGIVRAVDSDLETVLSARKNLLLNDAADIELLCADLCDIKGRYDIVLANLDIRTFARSSDHIKELAGQGGVIIVSGIIGREKKEALKLFEPYEPVVTAKKNTWLGFVLKKGL